MNTYKMYKVNKEDNYKIVDLAAQYGFKEEDVLKQVRDEYQHGLDVIQTKRNLREQDLKDLYVPTAKDNKVNINSIYTTMQTLMSVYYSDKMVVEWAGRKAANMEVASNLTRLSAFDYNEMKLEQLDYQWNWDRFFFGVGIKVIDGWNKDTNTPIARVMSPLSWIPDPRGGFKAEDHRWAGFEVEDSLANLKANKAYSNTNLINNEVGAQQEQIRTAYTQGKSINDQGFEQVENKNYSIYHHYTIIDGRKWLITTANNNSLIIRMVYLKPVTKDEKANPLKVPFPISLKYYSPVKGDPMGISVPDLQKDKQKAESKLFNLAIAKETRNTLGEDVFYNPLKIGNVKSLQTPSIDPKAIPVKIRGDEQIANVVYRMPKETTAASAFNANAQLQFQNSLSTGLDANTLGVQSGAGQTATEAQITQKNANLRFLLGTKIGKWGEETFWKLWKRAYVVNLSPRSKKVVYVTKAFGTQYFEFRKKDFITNEDIDVKIVSTSEKESKMAAQKADYQAIAPQLLSDPALPTISKNYIKRKLLRLSNISEEEINIMQPKTPDEVNAELDVKLINMGELPTEPKTGEDHLTYLLIYYGANDNQIKYEAIDKRQIAFLEEGGTQGQVEQAQALGVDDGTMGNIAQSNAAQQASAKIQAESNPVAGNINS